MIASVKNEHLKIFLSKFYFSKLRIVMKYNSLTFINIIYTFISKIFEKKQVAEVFKDL